MKFNNKFYVLSLLSGTLFFFNSCATYHEQKGKKITEVISPEITSKKLNHKFILVGDAGNANKSSAEDNLKHIRNQIESSNNKNTTVLFLGDNIYPKGMPPIDSPDRKEAEEIIDKQLDLVKKFKGNTFFIAGNHDWYNGLEGLIEQKNYVSSHLKNKKAFMPRQFESINKVKINDDITLITIDSEWFIQDWNKYNEMNYESGIRSREDFFEEFRRLINQNQNKITLVAIHHPLFSGGQHGGYYSLRSHLYPYKNIPLPVLGSVINYLRKTTGASPADMQYKIYQNLIKRIQTIVTNQDQVILISGHEHNLQYIENQGIKQIISGSATKKEESRAIEPISYSIGKLGYGVLNVFDDKETEINFFTTENDQEELVFRRSIYQEKKYDKKFPILKEEIIEASVYEPHETKKNGFYRFLFGNHYRDIYSTKVKAPVAYLDTLYGGLTPLISGGGNQSLSLRLVDKDGKQFVMRGVRKSPEQFIQSAVFRDVYVKEKIKNTYILPFIDDFYTTSHPYTPFIIGNIADAVNLNHSNPKLFYIPKQEKLGRYNENFGDQLYLVEERLNDTQLDADNLGNPDDIVSTQDVLMNLEKDDKYEIDTEMYLKARVFDFLVGDWDRHADQWRWSSFKKGDKIIYQPIARDRDQAFAKIDGNALVLLKQTPALRHMQSFKPKFARPRWITKTAFPLDKAFLQNTSIEDWEKAAQEVVNNITDEVISDSFALLPVEVQNADSDKIQEILKERREKLVEYSKRYYRELMKFGIVFATNKKNKIEIITSKDNVTINVSKLKNKDNQNVISYTYDPKITKEIWVYGLDDDDLFEISGEKSPITIRVMGGENHDTYDITSKNRIKIYDYASDKNTIVSKGSNTNVVLRDNYELNQYDYRNVPLDILTIMPDLGYNKDNGIMLGVNLKLTTQKYYHQPFFHKHQLRAKMDFATSGTIFQYLGKFRNNTRSWYYQVDLTATSSNFSQNYFGHGNETTYDKKMFKKNFNRVRTEQYFVKPSYNYQGRNGGNFLIGPTYESTKIVQTNDRFIDYNLGNEEYKAQEYYGGQAKYEFSNFNNKAYPTLGLEFMMHYGYRFDSKDFHKNHSFIASNLHFIVPVNRLETITFETTFYAKKLVGSDYHFYQAADLGSNNYLRGFRENRFIGHSAFAQSSDVNFKISELNRGIVPFTYGVSAGFDYGRVWQKDEISFKWHTSFGGGLWIDVIDSMTLKMNVYKSTEDLMFTFGFKYGL